MKKLLVILLLFFVLGCEQKSSLPECEGTDDSQWTNCFGTGEEQGHIYAGEFKDGKAHGQGTYTWPNGNKYVGEHKDGKMHGQGTHTWPNGNKYVGEWLNGEIHGQGTYTWTSGEFADGKKRVKYVGEHKDGKPHGQGTMTWIDGEKYVGEFEDDRRYGQGTMTYPTGNKYVGEWKYDKPHGEGTLTIADGGKRVGIWNWGAPVGEATYTFAGGDKDVVEQKDDKPVKSKVEISKGLEEPADIAWKINNKIISPKCLRQLWLSLDFTEELYKQFMEKNPHNNKKEFADFYTYIGIHLEKEVPIETNKTAWGSTSLSIIEYLNNCNSKIYDLTEKEYTKVEKRERSKTSNAWNEIEKEYSDGDYYVHTERKDLSEPLFERDVHIYKILYDIPLDLCVIFAPHVIKKFECIDLKYIESSHWGGGSMGYVTQLNIYGMFRKNKNDDYFILPLVYQINKNTILNIISNHKIVSPLE